MATEQSTASGKSDSNAQHTTADTPIGTPSQPAYFLSLAVRDMRCFKGTANLDLSDGQGRPAPWTILLGDNGTGKTSLLQCLAWLQPVHWDISRRAGLQGIQVPRIFRSPVAAGNGSLVTSGGEVGLMSAGFVVGAKLRSSAKPKRVDHTSFEFFTDSRGRTPGLKPNATGLICYGYGAARRLGGTGLSEDATTHPDACASLFDDDAALTNAEEWFLRADYTSLKFKDDEAKRRFEAVKTVLTRILPGVTDIAAVQPEHLSRPPIVEVTHEGVRVPLRALSSGYRSVLVWMVDLVTRLFARYPQSSDPLAEPAIVLVDQIDLHLHPRWQRELIGRLSEIFKNTQFIVTAHSPLIVQAAAAAGANVAVLKREGDAVHIHQDVHNVRGWRIDQILASELFDEQPSRDKYTEDLLLERRLLLSKRELSPQDHVHLRALEHRIGPLPSGESPDDIEARAIIRRAAERLRRQGEANNTSASKEESVEA